MKQFEIIKAYKASEQLSECGITEKEQWEVYKLRKFLRSHYEFQVEREDAIREKYAEYTDENGIITGEKAKDFLKDMKAAGDLEIDLEDYPKPEIRIAKGITCKIMEPLEAFIEFLPPAE